MNSISKFTQVAEQVLFFQLNLAVGNLKSIFFFLLNVCLITQTFVSEDLCTFVNIFNKSYKKIFKITVF